MPRNTITVANSSAGYPDRRLRGPDHLRRIESEPGAGIVAGAFAGFQRFAADHDTGQDSRSGFSGLWGLCNRRHLLERLGPRYRTRPQRPRGRRLRHSLRIPYESGSRLALHERHDPDLSIATDCDQQQFCERWRRWYAARSCSTSDWKLKTTFRIGRVGRSKMEKAHISFSKSLVLSFSRYKLRDIESRNFPARSPNQIS